MRLLSIVVIAAGVVSMQSVAALPAYTLTALNTPAAFTNAYGINNKGEIAGDTYYLSGPNAGYSRATLWTNQGSILLPTLGRYGDSAAGINDSGTVVGTGQTAVFWRQAVTWSGSSNSQTLTGDYSVGTAINNLGQITGGAGSLALHATIWANGSTLDLGTLGGTTSIGLGINDAGTVVGYSSILGDASQHAFISKNGVMVDIGVSGQSSAATAINDASLVVGYMGVQPGMQHATLWDGSSILDLGTLGGRSSVAKDINNIGTVVGYSSTAGSSEDHAVLWLNGKAVDLNSVLGPNTQGFAYLERANAINDKGQIVGVGRTFNGATQGFLLSPITPVPEPMTYILMISGLALLFAYRRKPHGITH